MFTTLCVVPAAQLTIIKLCIMVKLSNLYNPMPVHHYCSSKIVITVKLLEFDNTSSWSESLFVKICVDIDTISLSSSWVLWHNQVYFPNLKLFQLITTNFCQTNNISYWWAATAQELDRVIKSAFFWFLHWTGSINFFLG